MGRDGTNGRPGRRREKYAPRRMPDRARGRERDGGSTRPHRPSEERPMSATVHPSPGAWAAAHRLVLALALAVVTPAVIVTVVLLTTLPRSSAPGIGGSLPTVDARCAEIGPATPC